MELKDRIIKYILNNPGVNMDTIIDVAKAKGYSQQEVLTTLDAVHKDKRITHTANASGVVTYKPAIAKVTTVPTHVSWLAANYPRPSKDWQEPFPEIDLSHLFLKTLEERQAYQAQVKGMPIHMIKQKTWQK